MVDRKEVQASKTFPAFTVDHDILSRAPDRQTLTAATTFPALTTTATVRSESPLTGTIAFPTFTAAATVQTRMPTGMVVEANATYPAFTSTANVRQRTLLVESAQLFQALTAAATVQTRTPNPQRPNRCQDVCGVHFHCHNSITPAVTQGTHGGNHVPGIHCRRRSAVGIPANRR